MTIITVFITTTMSKSAQLPLHTWLADTHTLNTNYNFGSSGISYTTSVIDSGSKNTSGGKSGPGSNPASHGNKGANIKKEMPTSLSSSQLAIFVAILVTGPFQIMSNYGSSSR